MRFFVSTLFFLFCFSLAAAQLNANVGFYGPVSEASDSGDFEWFVGNGEFLSSTLFAPDLSAFFYFDFGARNFAEGEHDVIPSNVVPLLRVRTDSNFVVNFSLEPLEHGYWELLVAESEARFFRYRFSEPVQTAIDLKKGDMVFLVFNADDYGLVKSEWKTRERSFRLWVNVVNVPSLAEWVKELPGDEKCPHLMTEELSTMYCGKPMVFCISDFRPECSWDEIFSCQLEKCYNETRKSLEADKSALAKQLQEAKSKAAPELAKRVSALDENFRSYAEQLAGEVEKTRQSGFFAAGQAVFSVTVFFVVALIGLLAWFAFEWLVKRKRIKLHGLGEKKDSEGVKE